MSHRIGIILLILSVTAAVWLPTPAVANESIHIIEDNFNESNDLWTYLGSASKIDDGANNQVLQLTPAQVSQSGTIWLNQVISSSFDVEFKYRMLNNRNNSLDDGADGIVFMFNKQQNLIPINGGGMGFEIDPDDVDNGNGYGVEFDTYHNGEYENSGSHIALFHKTPSSNASQHLLKYQNVSGINSSSWKYVRIEVRTGLDTDSVHVYWGPSDESATLQLSWIAQPGTLDLTYDGIGFSSSTGWGYSKHQIDDVRITSYDSEVLEPLPIDTIPPTIQLLGPAFSIIEQGGRYEEQGVTVTDNVYHDLQAEIIGEVNVNISGTYILSYEVSDGAGNEATPVTRTVVVVDRPAVVEQLRVNEERIDISHILTTIASGFDLSQDDQLSREEMLYLLSLVEPMSMAIYD